MTSTDTPLQISMSSAGIGSVGLACCGRLNNESHHHTAV